MINDENNTNKKWHSLVNISGNGGRSIYQNEAYHFQFHCDEEMLLHNSHNALNINVMMRMILTNESSEFLRNHIRSGMKIAVEVMHNNEHMIGFINAEELLHIERKRIRKVVSLFKFNNEVMMRNCGYDSNLFKSSGEFEALPILDENGKQSFIVVEVELTKPLNEEIYEDSREEALTRKVDSDKDEKFSFLRESLKAISRNLLMSELNPSKALLNAISNGELEQIKEKLVPQFRELTSDFMKANELFEESLCKFSSKLLNEKLSSSLLDDQKKTLLGKFYEALGMRVESDRIVLGEIVKNRDSETAWLNSGVHYMRRECYEKAIVCIEEALRLNEVSFVGNILKEFLDLKIGKINDCVRIRKWKENFSEDQSDLCGLLNNSHEIVWDSMKDDKMLSWHNNHIKFAITFIKLGCYDFAEEEIGEYYANYGSNINYFYLLAAIDAQRGDHDIAIKHLKKIVDHDLGNHQVFVSHVKFN